MNESQEGGAAYGVGKGTEALGEGDSDLMTRRPIPHSISPPHSRSFLPQESLTGGLEQGVCRQA